MNAVDVITPLLPDLSLGGLLGFCAGFAIKKASRVLILVVGVVFVLVQILAYYGIITVHWTKVQELAEPVLRTGAEDGGAWALEVLRANLPFGGAFVAGLLLGLRAK
ncbi:FUN14 domain-containing protein [Deinococcus yavapaiensis]|uniref:Putative membrane protein (Fun14 family) n=1 Tax=Deinococcus yavapaiensis KR-236 TaxID=694435 RepID=A0A318S770_9DEIO|nr:FUN14 domain-containing protein [Deinococcus yavapaiensis]PYE53537.1 putative membrane protein (Fun14 family) [Deinococcus yavapaiensis KR-236]